jgi:hypothetical protein
VSPWAHHRRRDRTLTYDAETVGAEAVQSFELEARFEELLQALDDIRIADLWPHATDPNDAPCSSSTSRSTTST